MTKKRILLFLAALAVLAAVLGVTAKASATTAAAARRCVVSWDGNFTALGATSADLETNTCNDTMQVRIQCHVIITNRDYWVYSSETNQLEHTEGATCSGVDVGLIGQIQYPDCSSGCWHTIGVARAPVRSCSINVKVTHGPGTTNAKINQSCGEKIRAWETFNGSAGTVDGPWKTSGTSTAWYSTSANAYTGGYQRMNSRGTVFTITTY